MKDFYQKELLNLFINKKRNKTKLIIILNVLFLILSVSIFLLINRQNVNYLKYVFYAVLVLASFFDIYYVSMVIIPLLARIKFLKEINSNTAYVYENVNLYKLDRTLTKRKITFQLVKIKNETFEKDVLIEKENLEKLDLNEKITVVCKDNIICVVK